MAEIKTETGKKWLKDFQGSEKRMRERIIAIESEIRQMVLDEEDKKSKK
jgi:hypothetical protein